MSCLSCHDATEKRTQNDSLNMLRCDSFHWEAFFFPLRESIPVSWLRSTQQEKADDVQLQNAEVPTNCLHFKLRRCCQSSCSLEEAESGNEVSSERSCLKLWYQWKSYPATAGQAEWHNGDGKSQALLLQSPEHRLASGMDASPPPLDTPATDPLDTPATAI